MTPFKLPALALFLVQMSTVLAQKQVWAVQVGQGGPAFSPTTVYASVGDVISFQGYLPGHDVVSGGYGNPCQPAGAAQAFFSGLLDMVCSLVLRSRVCTRLGAKYEVLTGQNQTFTITLNTTDPVWLYCSVADHCQIGMIAVINPPK